MVQVTMTGTEYTDLVHATQILDQVKNSCSVVRNPDNDAVSVQITGMFIPEIKEAIAQSACAQVLADEQLLRVLVEDEKNVLDIKGAYFRQRYGRLSEDEFDMLDIPEFKKAWDKIAENTEVLEDGE